MRACVLCACMCAACMYACICTCGCAGMHSPNPGKRHRAVQQAGLAWPPSLSTICAITPLHTCVPLAHPDMCLHPPRTLALSAGFFEDKAADAKARGEVPKTKQEMDQVGLSLGAWEGGVMERDQGGVGPFGLGPGGWHGDWGGVSRVCTCSAGGGELTVPV